MATKTIFISFDYDNDRHYKNLLLDSTNATYIKSKIKPLIEKATHLLCIVGEQCGNNKWIEWEVQTAVNLKKKLIAVDQAAHMCRKGVGSVSCLVDRQRDNQIRRQAFRMEQNSSRASKTGITYLKLLETN